MTAASTGHRPAGRALSLGRTGMSVALLVLVLFTSLAGHAAAAPVTDLADLPPKLAKYVPASPAWNTSPWMTAEPCRSRGGDFSRWVATVLADTPDLLAHFQESFFGPQPLYPEDKPRNDAILAGYRALAVELTKDIPGPLCVNDIRSWVGTDPGAKPFAFPWGLTPGKGTSFGCIDRQSGFLRSDDVDDAHRYVGAERAPCDAFYLQCTNTYAHDRWRCEEWNKFSDLYVRRVEQMRGEAIKKYPGSTSSATGYEMKSIPEVVDDITGGWFSNMTRVLNEGAVRLLSEAMTYWTKTDRRDMLTNPAIPAIQNLLYYVGISLLVGSMIWQGIQIMFQRKIDNLISIATGLLAFVGWSTLGGTLALLVYEAGIALAEHVLDNSINLFAKRIGDAMQGQIGPAPGAIFLLSFPLFLVGGIQWALGFFRMGALVILLCLLPLAAAGQLNKATKPWLLKVLSWCLSLILYQPIAAIIFSIGLQLLGHGTDFSTILVGLTILVMAVISMPTMMRFFDWGGQQLVNSGGSGSAAAGIGAAASSLGNLGIGASRTLDGPQPQGDVGNSFPASASLSPANQGIGPGLPDGSTSAASEPPSPGRAESGPRSLVSVADGADQSPSGAAQTDTTGATGTSALPIGASTQPSRGASPPDTPNPPALAVADGADTQAGAR
ncbi:hypothetical protein GCM10022247_34960 [Allokutzneria multivorans]|uniref:TrbL/VirB6 plasmid conjugal transfer protein n=1 Tax=Allokutzneria multivorans TaxID=1142134 RepID=A0ABP7SCD8_9PSEU